MTQEGIISVKQAVYEDVMQVGKPPSADGKEAAKENKSKRIKNLLNQFLYLMNEKKIYLDPHVNLYGLSLLLCTNTTYLSKIINRQFGCNLKTLLNRYRINYAKELLKKEKCVVKNLPPLCGFLSRSTFYAVFTKFEHVTPVEFRQQYRSSELLKRIELNILQRNVIE